MQHTKRLISHSTIYAGGVLCRQIVGFLMLPIYTRYLTPADYGVVSLLLFIVSLFELVLGGQMFSAVPKFFNEATGKSKKDQVVATALSVTGALSAFSCLAMIAASGILSVAAFGSSEYQGYVSLCAALILTHALEQYGFMYVRLRGEPWIFLWLSLLKLALQLFFNVTTIIVLDLGLHGLVLSTLMSSVMVAGGLLLYTLRCSDFSVDRHLVSPLLAFSWPLWVSGLLGLYIGSSNRYFIRVFSSLDDVGLFGLAAKLGTAIGLLVWTPFSQYWQTERFAVARLENPYPVYSSAFRIIAALLIAAGVVVCVYAEPVISVMSATPFHGAASAVPYLAFAGIFQSLTIFFNFSFMLTGRTNMIFRINLLTAIAITVFNLILIPNFGFVGAAAAFAAATILQYWCTLAVGKRMYDLRIQQTPLAVSFVTLATVAGAVMELDLDNFYYDLAVRGAMSACALILIFRFMTSRDERELIRETFVNRLFRRRLS